MHIAFISYEYPPETPNGGIATYVQQAARMLHSRGHDVEVFAGSLVRDSVQEDAGVRVHRVLVGKRPEFADRMVPRFAQRHSAAPFDVAEGPDYDADARLAAERLPALPLVVRLHTPAYLAATLNDPTAPSRLPPEMGTDKTRCPLPLPGYHYSEDHAYRHILRADAITAPSRAIREVICRDWGLAPAAIDVFPNVYQPAPALLSLPLDTRSRTVCYLGRLEQRKGVIALAHAVPLILAQFPDVRFTFTGRALASPDPDMDMREYLERLLAPYANSVTISQHVPLESVPDVLGEAEVCVFPSLWENFPGVCLEAMAAGRGIVGSWAGGMGEMLADNAGIRIEPDSPEQIASAAGLLLARPQERMQVGARARERVQALYGASQVGPQQEASYRRAIQRSRRRGSRQRR